mgnify:CR=1 FL=1
MKKLIPIGKASPNKLKLELNKLFTGELINPEIKPILDGLVLEYYHKHLLNKVHL